jgi:hypothetical protein
MATMERLVGGVKEQLGSYLPAAMIHGLCGPLGHRFRQRQLTPALTIHLMCWQILAHVGLTGLRHVAHVQASAQAICQARQALPLRLLQAVVAQVWAELNPGGEVPRWKGHRLLLVDGVVLLTQDTPELAERLGKVKNHRGLSPSYPQVRLLAVLDYATGLIAKVIALPRNRQEQTCLHRLFKYLEPGDLLLGDRGLVSFAHLALLQAASLAGCFRLKARWRITGRRRPGGRKHRRLGRQDHLVYWTRRNPPPWLSRRAWAQLPAEILLRQIAYRIVRPGFRTRWGWLITTLTDPVAYPAQDLVELYGRRWQVEVCFRDLKGTLKLRQFTTRSLTGVRKEILACVLIYNLVRCVMLAAAERQQVQATRLSFNDALLWLLYAPPGAALPPLKVNRRRIRPNQPRRLKRAGYRFPPLRGPRSPLKTPPARCVI